ncbi:hypothetical protein N0V94_006507 [Neodidymelliopsis sp. IMI 364377]|nr:hypothetical protein N0V94_006507 [Neodidymelliopsis sp. IMI 364377]
MAGVSKKPEIKILPCTPSDAAKIAEGLYTCFPVEWWTPKEPPLLHPTDPAARAHALAQRLLPTITHPNNHWLNAVTPTGDVAGMACWIAPGAPIHSLLRRDAVTTFNWDKKMGWSTEDIDAMWSHVNDTNWSEQMKKQDEVRADVLGDEAHWYLGSVFTWPEARGTGAAKKLIEWAIEQADAQDPVTPMWLESRPTARGLYEKMGFRPVVGEYYFVRRGPIEEGKEVEKAKEE